MIVKEETMKQEKKNARQNLKIALKRVDLDLLEIENEMEWDSFRKKYYF